MSLEALLRFDEDEVARVLAVARKRKPLPVIDQLAAHADDEAVSAVAVRLAVKGLTHPLLVSLILRNAKAKTLKAKARVTEGLYYASFHGHNDLSEAQAFLLSGIGNEAFVARLHTDRTAKARQLGAWIDGFHLASKGNAEAMREAVKLLGASERKHWLAGASEACVLDPNIFHEDVAAARKDAERRRAVLKKL